MNVSSIPWLGYFTLRVIHHMFSTCMPALSHQILIKIFFIFIPTRLINGLSSHSYYIGTFLPSESKPLILVPVDEVQNLFDEIREQLGLIVRWPLKEKAPGFLLKFSEADTPRPQYLGRLDLHHSLDEMEAKIPPQKKNRDATFRAEDRSFAAFKRKMEDAIEATKHRNKNQRDKKKKQRIGTKQIWCAQMKRTQCYLGIRPRADPSMPDPVQDPDIPVRELEREIKRYNLAQCRDLPDLDVSEAAPFPFQSNVVFICVDVEAYEKPPRPITEIGISTLDTNDLVDLAPGERGTNWMKKIRSRHFRISETGHLHNKEHVQGCADRFEPDFGVSEWISIKEAPQVIASCFRPPLSRPSENTSVDSHGDESESEEPKRQLVLVGHDVQNDVEYLRKIGYDVANLSNLIEAVDTADLYRAWKHEQNPSNLGAILLALELIGWNLHNAVSPTPYTEDGNAMGNSFCDNRATTPPTPSKPSSVSPSPPVWHPQTTIPSSTPNSPTAPNRSNAKPTTACRRKPPSGPWPTRKEAMEDPLNRSCLSDGRAINRRAVPSQRSRRVRRRERWRRG